MRRAGGESFAYALALLLVVAACDSPHGARDLEPDTRVYRVDEVCRWDADQGWGEGAHFRALLGRYRVAIPCEVRSIASSFPLRRDQSLRISFKYWWRSSHPDRIDHHGCPGDGGCDDQGSLITASLTPKRGVGPSQALLNSWEWVELSGDSPVKIGAIKSSHGTLAVKIVGSSDHEGNPIYYLCSVAPGFSLARLQLSEQTYVNTCRTMGWRVREELSGSIMAFFYQAIDLRLLAGLHRSVSIEIESYILGKAL